MLETIKKYFKYELGPAITNIPWKKIPPATYVGWIMAIILSINSILMLFGLSPINYNEDSLAKVVTLIVNIVVLIANTYNNNSTSSEAVFGDKIITALKLAEDSDKQDAIDKINVVLTELNNRGAYATIIIPDDEHHDESVNDTENEKIEDSTNDEPDNIETEVELPESYLETGSESDNTSENENFVKTDDSTEEHTKNDTDEEFVVIGEDYIASDDYFNSLTSFVINDSSDIEVVDADTNIDNRADG